MNEETQQFDDQGAAQDTGVPFKEDGHACLAVLDGEQVAIPDDLYIPPEALRVFLEAFEGPLDLLLYLIRKQKIAILDIPITKITRQYIEYVDMMQAIKIDLAAEYLLMAAMLAEIKSRMLLPQLASDEEEEGVDPRAELVRRLHDYVRYQKAAYALDARPLWGRDFYAAQAALPVLPETTLFPSVAASDLPAAMLKVGYRAKNRRGHCIEREPLSVRERMLQVLEAIKPGEHVAFKSFYRHEEGAPGVVVSLLAVLELNRQRTLDVIQVKPYGAIYIKTLMTLSDAVEAH